MSGILQTYHATSDESRGLHAFTTAEPFEALALANALKLRQIVGQLLNWSDLIGESVAQTHGEGKTTRAVQNALADLDAIHAQAGGAKHG